MTLAGFGVDDFGRALIRDYAEGNMLCQIKIVRGQLGALNEETGYVPGLQDAETIYEGKARVYAVPPGTTVQLGGGEIAEQTGTVSYPIDGDVANRDDLVTVIDGGPDFKFETKHFRVLGSSGGGQFGDARRLAVQAWTPSRTWGEM